MKLYTSPLAPNPRRVHIFLAEKGIEIETIELDLGKMEHKAEGFTAVNPLQRVPVLELDDGTCLSESIAICRYFEELHPEPPLFGIDTRDRALVEMWQRRMELNLLFPVATVFRHLHPAMAQLEKPQIPEWGEASKPRVMAALKWLDVELATRAYIAGERFTVADITAFVALAFMKPARLVLPDDHGNVRRWQMTIGERPSVRR